ncbi:MAG: hypothetical protein RR674_02475 [Anaerorhabdus sp.]
MLKLMKFEMIHSYRSFVMVFGIFLLACFVVPFLPYDISAIGASFLVFAVFGIAIAIFVTIIRNYNNSMFKKPGYLTLTLPVSTHELIIAKVLSAVLWLFMSSIVLLIGLMIIILTVLAVEGYSIDFNEIFISLSEALKYFNFNNFLVVFASFVLEAILTILGFFALITIVQTKYTRNHKTALGFLIFILYTFVSVLIVDQFGLAEVANGFMYINGNLQIDWLSWGISAVQIIIFYFVTIFVIDKKIELE